MTSTPLTAALSTMFSSFSSCLIHVINFSLIDLKDLNHPVILSRYTKAPPWWFSKQILTFYPSNSWRDYTNKSHFSIQNEIKDYDLVLKQKWTCLSQFYLFPPWNKSEDSKLLEKQGLSVPKAFKDFGVKSLMRKRCGSVAFCLEDREFEVTSRDAYRFLISKERVRHESWVYWNMGIHFMTNRYPATYLFHIATSIIITPSSDIRVSNAFVVCLTCYHNIKSSEISSLENIPNLEWIKSKYKSYLSVLKSRPIEYRREIHPSWSYTLKYNNWKTRIYYKHYFQAVDLEIIDTLFPNRSNELISNITDPFKTNPECKLVERICFDAHKLAYLTIQHFQSFLDCCDRLHSIKITNLERSRMCRMRQFNFNEENEDISLVKDQDIITYMTCTLPESNGISFAGLVEAFDLNIWICIALGKFDSPVLIFY